MKERITNNLGLKILSVVLAVFMWLIMVNVSNPLVTDDKEVTVEILNEDILKQANLTYEMVGKKTVTVSYKVRTRDQYRVRESDFYAYADLAELYDVTGAIPVKVEVSNTSTRSLLQGNPTAKPGVVRIQTEPLQKKRFELTAHTEGETEEGFAQGDVALNPKYVYVTGAESVIGQISSAGVSIKLEGANSDIAGVEKVRLYDANGNELTGLGNQVELSLGEVDYNVTILKVKSLALDFQVSGTVAEGYRFTGVESGIRSISVEGLKSALASISTLTVPAELLNVNGATSDVQVEVDLAELLPDNITIANGMNATIVVTLKVEPLVTKEVECELLNVEFVGAKENYSYYFNQDQVVLQIRGLKEDLERIQPSDIQLSIDVGDMEPGIRTAGLDVSLSEGFEAVGQGPLMIMVEDLDAEPESQEGGGNHNDAGAHTSASSEQ